MFVEFLWEEGSADLDIAPLCIYQLHDDFA